MRLLWRPEIVLLLIFGAFLRLIGIYPGYFAHGDEIMYGEAVYMLQNFTLGMEPQFIYYPPLIAWLMLFIFLVFFIPINLIWSLPLYFEANNFNQFFNQIILGKNWINAMYWGRYITAFFSIAVILLTYLTMLKIFKNRLMATLSAFFVCINYRLVLNSKIGFLDIYNVFFLMLTIFIILSLLEKPTFKKYIFSWISASLLFLVKYQFYGFLLILISQIILIQKKVGDLKAFLYGGIISLFLIAISHFYHFQKFTKMIEINQYQALKYGFGSNVLNIFPISYWYHVGFGQTLSFFAILGIIISFSNKKYRIFVTLLISILFMVGYLYLYNSRGGFYTRNFLVAIPIMVIFASYVIVYIYEKLRFNRFLAIFFLFTILFLSSKDHLRNILVVNSTLSRESDKKAVQNWIDQNIPEGIIFATYPGNPVPNQKVNLKQLSYIDEVYSYQELLSENYDFALMDFFVTNQSLVWWMNQPTEIGLKFWKKPDDLLSQNYFAIATRELLFNHTVHTFLPKWQIPGYNYFMVKLDPPKENSNLKEIQNFNFESGIDGWQILSFFPQAKNLLQRSDQGSSDPGSLMIKAEIPQDEKIKKIYSLPGSLRWQSPTITVKPLHKYKVTAWIKSSVLVDKNKRNGFLRLDFDEISPQVSISHRPIISLVSSRFFGENTWQKIEIEAVAEQTFKFMTISFQADRPKVDFYIDNIEIFESEQRVETGPKIHYFISDDDFFPPNDGGFL